VNAIRFVRWCLWCSLSMVLLQATAAFAVHADMKGTDPALFSRMPNFYLSYDVKTLSYKDFAFHVGDKPGSWKDQVVEGRYSEYTYAFDESTKAERPSELQIVRNYQNAALKAGGQIMSVDSHGNWVTLRFTKDGKETWVFVEAGSGGGGYKLFIVEKQDMKQDVNANVDAAALASGLTSSGHVEVPGIFFDFGKADVKPESDVALKEVVKLLQTKPTLKLWVVGHTDYVGGAESNITLSNARAAAVVKVLTQRMSIDAKRLAPFGAGPYAPVASNKADDGRARNRRVELVEQP
jgi:OmpA-OmpF porin, OOP family